MNYQKELDKLLEENRQDHRRKRLLIHSCCAPCSSYVLEYLRTYFEITVFYYNPNITDYEEYKKRAEEQRTLIEAMNREALKEEMMFFVEGTYEPEEFYKISKGLEQCPEGGVRCEGCFLLRLEETAALAQREKFDYFVTSLTISPLKNAEQINQIGQELSKIYQVNFLPSDFKKRNGYLRSVELSQKYGLYRQDYCGCIYSKIQRLNGDKISGKNRKDLAMYKILDLISKEVKGAFEKAGYEEELGKVTVSNRPDLCEYQCNGAMAGAKKYKKAPLMIANEVAEFLKDSLVLKEAQAVAPGFLNLKIKEAFLTDYLGEMKKSEKFGLQEVKKTKTIIIDYGGPNVAKPLHVGHLRSAVIGESVKRIARYNGHKVIGDIHLGDWGLQMGQIIYELSLRQPELVYFDHKYEGEYPKEAPFTISELEEIYPTASKKSKEDIAYKEKAMDATVKLQNGVRGYRALWNHILSVSVADLKKNYGNLMVDFDLWKGESDVHDLIPGMVDYLKKGGYAHESEGALVVDVKEETDTKEIPPCMILKSDGASLYNTTDLATIMERMKEIKPDKIIYVVDKRQELYFDQIFRCALKTELVKPETELEFVGFGTMNGKDGKPFKTREGGVMRLENLITEINEEMYRKITENRVVKEEEARETAKIVALSAVKYGDLSNQASKDYVFDIERFTSFEGDTGPYILYTIVRIKSILNKFIDQGGSLQKVKLQDALSVSEKELMLSISGFQAMIENAYEETAPHKVCAYIYDLANVFNRFYHETKILTEEEEQKKNGYIALLVLTRDILETCIELLGFSSPERM